MSRDYTAKHIQTLLEDYHQLNSGLVSKNWPKIVAGRREYKANFEEAARLKADVEYAIQHLNRLFQLIVLLTYICHSEYDAAYWTRKSQKDIILLANRAFEDMADILNGTFKWRARDDRGRYAKP